MKVEITECYDIPKGKEAALQDAVANVGPIAIAIDADHEGFRHYAGGKLMTCAWEVMCMSQAQKTKV